MSVLLPQIDWTAVQSESYRSARATDPETGIVYVWVADLAGKIKRGADGKVSYPQLFRVKTRFNKDFRRMTAAGVERVAPEMDRALVSHLAFDAPAFDQATEAHVNVMRWWNSI